MTPPIQILLPALPLQASPARLSRWCVAVGQQVSTGEVIAMIDMGDTTVEVESTVSGRIERILVPENSRGMSPNVAIALITPNVHAGEKSGGPEEAELWQPLSVPMRRSRPIASSPQTTSNPENALRSAPSARAPEMRSSSAAAGGRIGSPVPEVRPRDSQETPPQSRPMQFQGPPQPHGRRPLPPPRARRAALGAMESEFVEDVQPPPTEDSAQAALEPHRSGKGTERAANPSESWTQSVPCTRLTIDCAVGALAQLRPDYQEEHSDSGFILPAATSPGVVFAKALGVALADIPAANVTWTPEGILHHRSADVAFSILLPELQVSPVIRNVDKRSLDEVALKVIDLTQRARAKVLDPSELKGAAAAILDLGAYGVRSFEPTLEPPRALSLSLGAKEVRPVVLDGDIRSAPIITCTLLCDARAMPVAVAAELLATIKALVEEPRGLLLPATAGSLF